MKLHFRRCIYYETNESLRCWRPVVFAGALRCNDHYDWSSQVVKNAELYAVGMILKTSGLEIEMMGSSKTTTLDWLEGWLTAEKAWDRVSWLEQLAVTMPWYYDIRRFPLYLHDVVRDEVEKMDLQGAWPTILVEVASSRARRILS